MDDSHINASASSSSSLSSSFQDTEDDQTIASILAEEESSKFDRRLGKRLSHLDSIPHTPRVNGEIPDVNDATLDHERLSERLVTYGLAELQMEGDGNCQFRAVADQLFRNPDYHKHVRKQVIKQLKHFRKFYEGYVPEKYRSYIKKMKKSGEWGDHITLQAAADRLNSIDAKLDKLCSMRDDMKKLEVAILAKYHVRVAIYKQFRDPKLEPSLFPSFLAKHCTRYPFKFDRCSTENLLLQQPQLHIGLVPQDKHEVDHGNFKTKEDIDVIAMGHSKPDFNLQSPLIIDFIIPYEFSNMVEKEDSLFVLLHPKVIEELVKISSSKFDAKICLVTSFRDTCYIEILPKDKNPTRELWLSFWSEVHYNSLYGSGDVPTRAARKKYWLF
uniref:OTU domain-containing protein n=1 Tax=Quercus lobata TaxID=97700 RepID=A0A7N2R3F2_QUELO